MTSRMMASTGRGTKRLHSPLGRVRYDGSQYSMTGEDERTTTERRGGGGQRRRSHQRRLLPAADGGVGAEVAEERLHVQGGAHRPLRSLQW